MADKPKTRACKTCGENFEFPVPGYKHYRCLPAVQIVRLKRSCQSVSEYGTNKAAEWKPDSSMIAVTTSKGYILFYRVEMEMSGGATTLYMQKEERKSGTKRDVVEISVDNIPALRLRQTALVFVEGGVTSVVCLREELMVASGRGYLERLRWDGQHNADMTIHLASIPFSIDLQHSRATPLNKPDAYFRQIQYSPLLGGFAVVLSNGKAAFITANTLKFEPSQVVGVWAQEVNEATCVAINHKYTLMAFGCKTGEGVVYSLDELTGALLVSHKLVVSSKDFPDASQVCGSVSCLKWTPDGCALAMVWEKGGFSLWSVFGALLVCSMGAQAGFSEDMPKKPILHIKSLEWGCEGYHLWMISNKNATVINGDSSNGSSSDVEEMPRPARLLQMQFVKSALAVNPCTTNHGHLFLQAEDRLYLGTEDSVAAWSQNHRQANSPNLPAMGNKQWQIVPIPHNYLAQNWPIRYASVNSAGHCVAVAGKTGLAHYALFTRKWKLFGNETQEHDMVVTGGLTWWKDFIVTACYNLLDQRDEIRFYPRDSKLDNTFSQVVRVPSQIMLLNTFHDILIVLCADCHIMIFRMERNSGQNNPTLDATKLQEVAIGNFIPHPATVVALTLTSLRTETASSRSQPQPHEAESIILNVAGKLLMFQRDRSGPQIKNKDHQKERPLPFCAPVMVASQVENMWSCNHPSAKKPHLTEALWLGCGAAGMKVWLPLHPHEDKARTRGFMSKRIMLPFRVDIYPLALLFEGGIIMGALSDSAAYQSASSVEEGWPFLQLERTSQLHLHHILRQLLRRNLGVHALEIAGSCVDLPYFAHAQELLLHEVLEEEATSKEPIPDPLLPRVVAFVQEFPEYLQTVVHCARKTEVALWQYLFSTVGNPKDLFEECLSSLQLDTAASYLIILQNLEKPVTAREHATKLLDKSLENNKWELARDLVRFLKAIDPSEADHPVSSTRTRFPSSSIYPSSYQAPQLSPTGEGTGFGYRPRSTSLPHSEVEKITETAKAKEKVKLTRSDSHNSKLLRKEDTAEQMYIDLILQRHGRKLLSAYRVRDLACFSANLEDYQLVAWLKRERLRAARVEQFVEALQKLHDDFAWPLPILTASTLHRIASMSSIHSEVPCLLEEDGNGADICPIPPLAPCKNPGIKPASTPDSGSLTADVMLQPQPSLDDTSLGATDTSDTGSQLGETESGENTSLFETSLAELEQLSQELANKGAPQSEHELRYLYQIFLEAGCLEWALLVAVILRDAMAVVRTVNTASLTDTPIEIVGRMREGMSYLELWADTECFGYKPFLATVRGQTQQLAKIAEQNPPLSRLPPIIDPACESASDSGPETDQSQKSQPSPHPPQIDRETDVKATPTPEEERYECRVS